MYYTSTWTLWEFVCKDSELGSILGDHRIYFGDMAYAGFLHEPWPKLLMRGSYRDCIGPLSRASGLYVRSFGDSSYGCVCFHMGVLFVGVLIVRALPFGGPYWGP